MVLLKGAEHVHRLCMALYLHSNMVLLKAAELLEIAEDIIDLHSNMVLLKDNLSATFNALKLDLHSNMVLLKDSSKLDNIYITLTFTFQYGSTEGALPFIVLSTSP